MPKVMVVDGAYSELQVTETILRSLDIVMPKRNSFEARTGIRGSFCSAPPTGIDEGCADAGVAPIS